MTVETWENEIESVCKNTGLSYEILNLEYKSLILHFKDGTSLTLRYFRGYWERYSLYIWNSLRYTPQQQPMELVDFINDIIERKK